MLQCENISLTHFRNYLSQSFSFTERIVGIFGSNGSGKTNLLDAIYYLCFTKSYFSKQEIQNVKQGETGFRIEGNFLLNDENLHPVCILRETGRKEFLLNDIAYTKFSNHIGKLPCVMIAPDDVSLITEASEERRRFIDTILSQLHIAYLQNLINYNKILQQRNSLLKAAAERNYLDESLLDILDKQLCENGNYIFQKRKEFLKTFLSLVKEQYNSIAGKNESVDLIFDSQLLNESLEDLLKENRQRDLYLQRTGCGIHKDDIDIQMKNVPFKTIASQGERKSLLFALKLSEFAILKEQKEIAPILLLDDVFEKLDAERMQKLLHRVCLDAETQIFITDTHEERLQSAFKNLNIAHQLIELNN